MNDLYKKLTENPENALPGIEVEILPWDRFQEVSIVDPTICTCDNLLDIARVMESPAIIGYFMHYDRYTQRRWYGHANWRLLDEIAMHIYVLEHVENVIAQKG